MLQFNHVTIPSQLNLSRQLLLGSLDVFEVTAVDAEGRISAVVRSEEFQLP